MAITKATLADVPELTALVNAAYRGKSSTKGWTNEAHLLEGTRINGETLGGYLLDANGTILKYTDAQGRIVGCVHLTQQADKLYLGMLTVMPNLQAGGIGRALLQTAEARALEWGCTAITITVISIRHELIAYYQRRGYQITGGTFPFPIEHQQFGIPKQPLELLEMEKRLEG